MNKQQIHSAGTALEMMGSKHVHTPSVAASLPLLAFFKDLLSTRPAESPLHHVCRECLGSGSLVSPLYFLSCCLDMVLLSSLLDCLPDCGALYQDSLWVQQVKAALFCSAFYGWNCTSHLTDAVFTSILVIFFDSATLFLQNCHSPL